MSLKSYNHALLICLIFTCLIGVSFPITLLSQIRLDKSGDDILTINGQWFLSYQAGEVKGKKFNQFFLNRGYITVQKTFSSKVSGRITPDISVDKEGDGEGDVELRLKYCYMKYELPTQFIFTKPFIEFGLVHRPWLDFEEHINEYRVQGTMFLERNKIFNSGDYGVTFVSYLGGEMDDEYKNTVSKSYPGKYGSVALGIYNGGGYHAIEKNTNKTFEWRLSFRPLIYVIPGLQVTYLGASGAGNSLDTPDWNLHSGFLSWEHHRFVLTGMYFMGTGNSSGTAINAAGNSLSQNGYSLFGELKFLNSKISWISRYDYFQVEVKPKNTIHKRYITGIAYNFIKGCKMLLDYDALTANNSSKNLESIFEFAIEVRY
ncbi:MAG: hypothetical protein MUC94_04755 [bacterium]|nr:hypothetical protein [bacterium]